MSWEREARGGKAGTIACLRAKQHLASPMANLPPKPESPLKEERRHDRVTTARPMATHHSPRVPDSDRSYVPRHQRSDADSYVAVYTSRRLPARDWERDRRDRDYDRHHDSRREWRDSDRRDTRPYDRRRDDDRFRPRRYGVSFVAFSIQGQLLTACLFLKTRPITDLGLPVAIHAQDPLFAAVHARPRQGGIPAPDHHEYPDPILDHHAIDLIHLLAPVLESFREVEAHVPAPHLRSDLNSVIIRYQIVRDRHERTLGPLFVLPPAHFLSTTITLTKPHHPVPKKQSSRQPTLYPLLPGLPRPKK